MGAAEPNKATAKDNLLIALFVILGCIGLILIDKDTKGLNDVFDYSNIGAIALYFLPAFIISGSFFAKFLKRNSKRKSFVLAILIGIPLSFTLEIIFLSAIRGSV
jgi:fucose permease